MKQTSIALLSIPELLDRSRQEIQNRFGPLFLLTLFVPIITWIIPTVLLGFSVQQQTETAYAHPFLALMSIILNATAVLWLTGALILYVCKRVQKISEALVLGGKKLPRLLVGMLLYVIPLLLLVTTAILCNLGIETYLPEGEALYWLANVLVMLLFLSVLIVLSVYCILLPYVLVLMEMPIKDCVVAAFQLVHQYFWRTLWLVILLVIISTIIGGLGAFVITFVGSILQFFIPASRYLFLFLGFIPAALSLLIFHIPLIAWYINLTLQLWSPEEQVAD